MTDSRSLRIAFGDAPQYGSRERRHDHIVCWGILSKIAYLTGTWPAWSETFIAQEVESLRALMPLELVAIRQGAPASGACNYLDDRPPTAGTQSSRAGLVPGSLRLPLARRRHGTLIQKLAEFATERGVSHIHAAFGGLPAVLAHFAADAAGLSWSVSVHAADVLTSPYPPSLYDTATVVLACNEHVAASLSHPRLHVIPHGLALDAWPMADLDAAPRRLFWAGRFVEKKQPWLAVEAVAALRETGVDFTLCMAGAGALMPDKREWLELPGVLPQDQILRKLQRSCALLLTSCELRNGDAEGIPNIVVEAMASGLPVVGTICGGVGQILSERTGWPVDGTASGYVATIEKILQDAKEVRQRALAARALVEARFDHLHCIQQRTALIAP